MENEQKNFFGYHQIFGIICITLFGLICLNSRFFAVKKISVLNNHQVSSEEIIANAQIKAGQSIFLVNIVQIKRNILKNPLFSAIRVQVQLPNKVLLDITERKPLCLIPYSKQLLIIAEDGVIIGSLLKPVKLPMVTGITPENPEMGKKIKAAGFEDAYRILSFTNGPLRQRLYQIDLKLLRLMIKDRQFPNGLIVELGNIQEIEVKIANLRAILDQPHSEAITGIDLRSPAMPTILTSGKN